MAVKDFTFDSTAESWSFTSGGKATGSYDGAEQALDFVSVGRNNSDISYWEWTGTWEDLGVTSGDTVTSATIDFDWRCYIANVSDGYTTGPAEIWNSDGTVLIGTSSTGSSGSGTTSYVTQSGISASISSPYNTSGTTIKLRVSGTLDNGNNSSATTGVFYDNISITITHEAGSTRRIFIVS